MGMIPWNGHLVIEFFKVPTSLSIEYWVELHLIGAVKFGSD